MPAVPQALSAFGFSALVPFNDRRRSAVCGGFGSGNRGEIQENESGGQHLSPCRRNGAYCRVEWNMRIRTVVLFALLGLANMSHGAAQDLLTAPVPTDD